MDYEIERNSTEFGAINVSFGDSCFYAQLLGHQLQQATYQRQSMYYRARTLAVLAQKLDLKPGQKASSAQGQVEMLKDQVKVFLPNGQKYTLDQIN